MCEKAAHVGRPFFIARSQVYLIDMKGPEGFANQQPDRDISVNTANERALGVLALSQVKMSDFSDLYGPEQIKKDSLQVADLAKGFEPPDEGHKFSNIFEAFICEEAELSEWFGGSSHVIKTCPYDDILNGVDHVIEYIENPATFSHLALAIDVTFRHDLGAKMARIQREIENGELAHVKYFKSQHVGLRGELSDIPRFVVATTIGTIKNLMADFINEKHNQFIQHPLRLQIIESLINQCQGFKDFATRAHQKNIAAKYAHTEELLRQILAESPIKNQEAVRQQFDEGYSQVQMGLDTLKAIAPVPKHRPKIRPT